MECSICLQPITNSCIGSCTHHFCYNCMIKWCKQVNQCPKCRCPIREIRYDPEFDLINGASNMEININLEEKQEKILKLSNDSTAGITLKNNDNGPGVKINKLTLTGQARKSGFNVGDIIIFMNGTPCLNHVHSIDIINQATISTKDIVCILL